MNTTISASILFDVLDAVTEYEATSYEGVHSSENPKYTAISLHLHGKLENVEVTVFSSPRLWISVHDMRKYIEWYENPEQKGPEPETKFKEIELHELSQYLRYLAAGVEWDIE